MLYTVKMRRHASVGLRDEVAHLVVAGRTADEAHTRANAHMTDGWQVESVKRGGDEVVLVAVTYDHRIY